MITKILACIGLFTVLGVLMMICMFLYLDFTNWLKERKNK
jgi:hypothetical protein